MMGKNKIKKLNKNKTFDKFDFSESQLKNKPYFPKEAPFSGKQRQWISGFLAGLQQNSGSKTNKEVPDRKTFVNFLYGTQTGNSETLAREAANLASKNNFKTELASLDEVSMDKLKEMKNVIFVVSTYGEGEMPDGAQLFWESLSSDIAPKLHEMQYGVLALGDTSYEMFCNAGKLIDFRLEQLGAKRLVNRIDCDLDFETHSKEWIKNTLQLFGDNKKLNITELDSSNELVTWNKKNPFFAEISANKILSGKSSNKEIRHYEIELSDSGISYEVGDTLSVLPLNDKKLVELIIKRLGVNKSYRPNTFKNTLQFLLLNNFEISSPNKDFINAISEISKDTKLKSLLDSNKKNKIDDFLLGKDILDLMNLDSSLTLTPEKFLSLLKPLQPRAYSISSSPNVHEGQVHLTISRVKWQNLDRIHKGVCSNFLADSESSVTQAGIFVTPNNSFRIPEDDLRSIIMIGPGTGLAPFRAFLEEREFRKAKGKNWLFFGDQTRKNDYIYKDEIMNFKKSGLLTKLDLAFSRDQKSKIYVQHKMKEAAYEFFKWIDEGAYIYVCGDANYMAKDVDIALHQIVKDQGKFNEVESKKYVDDLKREKRYLRDVY